MKRIPCIAGCWLLAVALAYAANALAQVAAVDLPPGLQIPTAAQPGPTFDVDRATRAYLDLLSPQQRARSDAYFEGRYWLQLWELLYTVGVMMLVLLGGISHRMRDAARQITQGYFLSTLLYAAIFIVLVHALMLPFAMYSGFIREHQYGLSNLTFPRFLREWAIAAGATTLIFAPVIALGYLGVRRTGARWWLWATGFAFAVLLFLRIVFPLAVAPLFNDYKPLEAGPVRDAIVQLARANGIPTEHLEWFDASRQTKRISANVSGIFGIARINLNDNLLAKTSLPEIKAVLGHEMGHYVLHHGFQLAVYFALLIGLACAILHLVMRRVLSRPRASLNLADRADPAALPLVVAVFSVVWFVFMPLSNSIVRTLEAEADAFGLNAAREPHGFAMVSMRLSSYRKLAPGPLEEFVFYDHPSGYNRVHRSMIWLQQNQR